jgi:hypothetical protein
MQVIEQEGIEEELEKSARAEANFTAEIGVMDRHFYQCVQQPHVIWANTEWRSEKDHNIAAAGIMKVRTDDRVASAYFRPGLYYEIFAREIEAASINPEGAGEAGLLMICHGVAADRWRDGWQERFVMRAQCLSGVEGILRCRTFYNYYAHNEFVGFLEWQDEAAYEKYREQNDRTLEEHLFVGERGSELAAYVQYECKPIVLTA